MEWNEKVLMDLGFDCTPPEGSSDTAWDIADSAVDRINNFLATEPEGSKSEERFESSTGKLYMQVEVPIEAISDAGALYTKLKNTLGNFPPLIAGQLPKFAFLADAYEEAVEE